MAFDSPDSGQGTWETVPATEVEDPNAVFDMWTAGNAEQKARAVEIVSHWPPDVQADFILDVNELNDSGGSWEKGQALKKAIQQARIEAFRNGELLPGVDAAGGGLGLSKDKIRGLKTGRAEQEAEAIRNQQPGPDAYQNEVVLDKGAGSLFDRLEDKGIYQDEDIDPFDLTEEELAQLERTDTTGVDAQERSLSEYDAIISEEGLTPVDRARIEEMRQDTARRARSQEDAIMADAAERGRSSGAASLLLRNQAQQAATNERALGDMRTAAVGLERKDSAIRNRGFLGGDIQAGQDAIDKFNTENTQSVRMRNTDRKNRATLWERDREEDNREANVGVKQAAIGTDFAEDTMRSDKNTDRTNRQNADNDAGLRGYWEDRQRALQGSHDITKTGPAYNNAASSHGGGGQDQNGLAAAGQGAIAGAGAGSAFGPAGSLVGGAAGGFLGYLGRQKAPRQYSGW